SGILGHVDCGEEALTVAHGDAELVLRVVGANGIFRRRGRRCRRCLRRQTGRDGKRGDEEGERGYRGAKTHEFGQPSVVTRLVDRSGVVGAEKAFGYREPWGPSPQMGNWPRVRDWRKP